MKDTSVSSRHPRNNPLYPKKRPSPNGVTKSRKSQSQSPLTLSVVAVAAAAASRRSPRAAKVESVLQRRRVLQLAALRREGILLEDEYREEIRYYMYEMERYTMGTTSSMDQQPEIKWHMRPCLV